MNQEIARCVNILKSGGTILYPTDTVWGIGCDATNPSAVEKIFRIKKRMESKSLIILLDDPAKLADFVDTVPEIALDLMKSVDTPLTIIYSDAKNIAPNVVADDRSIAIRVVTSGFCHRLIRSFGKPIVSTSANISGEVTPLIFRHISKEIMEGVDYVADESLDTIREVKPSQIIRIFADGTFRIIRK